jgi:adenine deaminase
LEHVPLILENGFPDWDAGGNAGGDLALIAVFARNGSSRCVGIVKDLGLRRGAYAASFTHDSHNLVAAGRDPADLALAANETLRQGGGLVVVENGRAAARLVLPVFGLLSDAPFESVARDLEAVEEALCRLGMTRRRPFLMLSLLTLSVSPYYKITDRGIVDTEGRRLLPAFEGDA